jgi:hypothetical protein
MALCSSASFSDVYRARSSAAAPGTGDSAKATGPQKSPAATIATIPGKAERVNPFVPPTIEA